jgi:hypothetical protein
MQVGLGIEDAGLNGEVLAGDSHLPFRMRLQILQPVCSRIFGDHIEAAVETREPDFDFARQTTLAAASGEIEILLTFEIIDL